MKKIYATDSSNPKNSNKNANANQWLSIRASAGSGKTFSLTSRFIYLLFLGAKVNEILTLTFTQKAQQEMQNRILKTLRELSSDSCDFALNPYILELSKLGLDVAHIQKNIKNIYDDFRRIDNHIMTNDAFFNMILRKFSFYLGLLNNYELGSGFGFEEEALSNTLEKMDARSFRQLAWFCSMNGLQAGKILDMLDNINVDDYYINISDFDDYNKAYMEWKDIVISNYNELKEYILSFISDKSGVTNIQKRLKLHFNKDSDIKDLLLLFDKENLILTPTMLTKLEKIHCNMDFVDTKIAAIKEAFRCYFDYTQKQVLSIIFRFYKNYKYEKLHILCSKNKLSFNDLNMLCYDLLDKHIDKDFFYFRLDARINHILVDEFQDTNIRQYLILKPLIEEIKSGIGRINHRSLFFVGDEKQAIYSFRGSDSKLFEAISKALNMNVETLPKNYRSAKNIVNFVNEVFKDKFKHYHPQIPDKNIDGYVRIVTKENKDSILEHVKERVTYLLDNNRKDIMILTRKNNTAMDIWDYLSKNMKDKPDLKISLQLESATNEEFLVLFNALKYIQTNNNFYIKNAIKLNGESYERSISLNVSPNANASSITLEIMKNFNLYGKVAISVLEKSFDYDDLGEFIMQLEYMTIQNEDTKYHIRISNIHKSKGLEFDDVILTEYGNMKNTQASFYYDYDGLDLKQIVYLGNAKAHKIVDPSFKEIYEKQQNENLLDSTNLLYVAFTRAKESLYIIKPQKSTFFDRLELQDMEIGQDISSVDDITPIAKSKYTPQLISQESFGKQDDFIQDVKKQYNSITRIKGIALHLAMEYFLKYGDYAKQYEIEHILLNKYGLILDKHHLQDIFNSVHKILNNALLSKIFACNPSIKCEVSYLNENNAIRRIDCLLETQDDVFILDYKSSDLDLEVKKKQVSEYLQFATMHFAQKNVLAYLCFASGEVLQVES